MFTWPTCSPTAKRACSMMHREAAITVFPWLLKDAITQQNEIINQVSLTASRDKSKVSYFPIKDREEDRKRRGEEARFQDNTNGL